MSRIKPLVAVVEIVEENLTIPCHYLKYAISQTTLHLILHKNLGLKVYKVQLTQQLK